MAVFNPELQFRCEIIRGRALDSILPTYAKLIEELCPCTKADFDILFNQKMAAILPKNTSKKALNNHRTEIAGKLFGMYYKDETGIVHPSERTMKLLADNDQPAFFKDIVFKFQFPNGMNTKNKVNEMKDAGIRIRQFPFILRLLLLAQIEGVSISKKDIGYYVLNSLQVLQGIITPDTVLSKIKEEREAGIIRKINSPGKAPSYDIQHINEQLKLLELANLVKIDDGTMVLNMKEQKAITYISSYWDKPIPFNSYGYDLLIKKENKSFYSDWEMYYSKLSDNSTAFDTSADSLGIQTPTGDSGVNTVEIGDEGELFVLKYEKDRVGQYNPRLVGKVIHLGKTKGLGYDIQSVVAEPGESEEFVKYIEVKSTKRVTAPDINDPIWIDTVNMTRTEWIAATQHKDSYFIYRVYFTQGAVIVYVIDNVFKKHQEGILRSVPLNYRVDFDNRSVDKVI